MTQEELAARAGITRELISRIENGGNCRHSTARKLADVLGCSQADLQTAKKTAPTGVLPVEAAGWEEPVY